MESQGSTEPKRREEQNTEFTCGGLGLCLSGGGFRATLFHLGVIRYLRDSGQLPRVTHITSVSGGSILAAHLLLEWEQYTGSAEAFERACQRLIEFVQQDVRGSILRKLPFHSLLGRTTTKLLQRAYRKGLFGDATFLSLPEGTPELHVLATNLSKGTLTSFSSRGIFIDCLRDEEPMSGTRSTPLAVAVAASSAYPGFFPEVWIDANSLGSTAEELHVPMRLQDGGIFDNLGARMMNVLSQRAGLEAVIMSDAGARIDWDSKRSKAPWRAAVRSIEVMMEQIHRLTLAQLEQQSPPPLLISIGSTANGPAAPHEELQPLLGRIRSDLDGFTRLEIDLLARHGYTVAQSVLLNLECAEEAKTPPREAWGPKAFRRTPDQERDSVASDREVIRKGSLRRRHLLFDPRDAYSWSLAVAGLLVLLAILVGSQSVIESGPEPITLDDFLNRLSAISLSDEQSLYRRGVHNNINIMVSEPRPITGDANTTRKLTLNFHTTLFLQGRQKLVKLQKFSVPPGAREVRARSRQTVDKGRDYEASTLAFLENGEGRFEEAPTAELVWSLDDEDAGKTFFLVALYDHHLFRPTGAYSGAEIGDLCGEVDKVTFFMGGYIEDLQLGGVFRLLEQPHPIELIEYKQGSVHSIAADRIPLLMQSEFKGFVEHLKKLNSSVAKGAVGVWDDQIGDSASSWTGFELLEHNDDLLFIASGQDPLAKTSSALPSEDQ